MFKEGMKNLKSSNPKVETRGIVRPIRKTSPEVTLTKPQIHGGRDTPSPPCSTEDYGQHKPCGNLCINSISQI